MIIFDLNYSQQKIMPMELLYGKIISPDPRITGPMPDSFSLLITILYMQKTAMFETRTLWRRD